MDAASKVIDCSHADAESFSNRKLPAEARYFFRIWVDGTVVLWQEMERPSWMPSRDVLISMFKNPHHVQQTETHHPSDRVLPHDH